MKKLTTKKQSNCPVCGGISIRFESEKSGFFWKCQGKCGQYFPDDNGKIMKPTNCPKCSKDALLRYKYQNKPDFFWRCNACEEFYQDVDGKPAPFEGCEYFDTIASDTAIAAAITSGDMSDLIYHIAEAAGCTVEEADQRIQHLVAEDVIAIAGDTFEMTQTAKRRISAAHEYEKKLRAAVRGAGKCPFCHGDTLLRIESTKKPGKFFWRCSGDGCGSFYNDENGQVGEPFGYDPAEINRDLGIIAKCRTADDFYKVLEEQNIVYQVGRRKIHDLAENGFIEINPLSEGGSITITAAGHAMIMIQAQA